MVGTAAPSSESSSWGTSSSWRATWWSPWECPPSWRVWGPVWSHSRCWSDQQVSSQWKLCHCKNCRRLKLLKKTLRSSWQKILNKWWGPTHQLRREQTGPVRRWWSFRRWWQCCSWRAGWRLIGVILVLRMRDFYFNTLIKHILFVKVFIRLQRELV